MKFINQFSPLVGYEMLASWVTIIVCIMAWRDSHISLVMVSSPAAGAAGRGAVSGAGCGVGGGCGGSAACGGDATCGSATCGGATFGDAAASILVSNPFRGGLSSASPHPLPLIGESLPRLPLPRPHPLGGMVLETKIIFLVFMTQP